MDKKFLLVVASGIVLAGTAWHFFGATNHKQQLGPTTDDVLKVVGTDDRGTTKANPNGNITTAIPGTAGNRAPLDGVRNYGDLQRRLINQQTEEPQRIKYLLTASAVCEGYIQKRGITEGAKKLTETSMSYYNSYVDTFCSNFSGSSSELEARLLSYENSDVVQAREISTMPANGLSRETKLVAETIVLTSNNPDAVYDSAAALAGQSQWELGQRIAQSAQEKAALPQAQWIASQMLACDLSGGCGPGGLTTMIECGSYNLCTPGVTVRELLEKTATPIQFELATRVYQQLLDDRKRVATAGA